MPAVLLSRLDQQIEHLAGFFNQPDAFYSNLTTLMELYADRTYHAGNEIPSSSRLPSYRIPGIVIQNLEFKFRKLAKTGGRFVLANADYLWRDAHLESKHLAIQLIGNAPLADEKEVVTRIIGWGASCADNFLLEYLLQNGARTILSDAPAFWLQTVQDLLASKSSKEKILGLKALLPLVKAKNFQDLPAIIDTVRPIALHLNLELFPEMLDVYELLLQRFPAETVASLKTILSAKPSPSMVRLVRRLFPSLSIQSQVALRAFMKEEDKDSLDNHPSDSKIHLKTHKKASKPHPVG